MKDYYKILELPFGAPSKEIKKAFYRLALKYHPDKNFGSLVFEEKFKAINEAYLVLSDEHRRIIYHAEYNDFLKGYSFLQQTIVPVYPNDPYSHPQQPRGPATRVTIEYKNLKMIILVLFIALIIFMIFESRGHMTEKEDVKLDNYKEETISVKQHLTKDEYYRILSVEFSKTNDSTLLKLDVDSMILEVDSIMNREK